MAKDLLVRIIGDNSSLSRSLKGAQADTGKFAKSVKVASYAAAGALAGLGLAAKVGFDELENAQKVGTRTANVIKSTGGAANVTASHVHDLADSLLQVSGVDDEVVQGGENVLLTFKNIQNQVGRTNDIFDQATKVALDMSVAMGTDMNAAALKIGKALNDPVKGLTSLSRVGVVFTDQQKKLIENLVKSGNTMEAQKLILGELQQRFGGAAAAAGGTFSGQIDKLRENFRNMAADLVKALLPALQSMVGVLQSVVGWMQRNEAATKILVVVIAALSVGVLAVNAAYKVWRAATIAVTAAQWLLNAALDANPVVLITAGIIALGVALVIAYKKSETFRNIVNGVFDAVKSAVFVLVGVWKKEFGIAMSVLHTLANIAGNVFDFIGNKVQSVINIVKTLWSWIQTVAGALQSLFDKAKSVAGVVGAVTGGGGPNNYRSPTNTKGGSNAAGPNVVLHTHVMLGQREVGLAIQTINKDFLRQNGRGLLAT